MENLDYVLFSEEVKAYGVIRRYLRPGQQLLLVQLVEQLCTDSGADSLAVVITNRRVESIKLRRVYKVDPQPD